ncbi:hypothetical protein FRB91_005898 [Serendipita sp. 411]|nr:hypothetical protein FRB91_005898 [Serendipita sp. 411]
MKHDVRAMDVDVDVVLLGLEADRNVRLENEEEFDDAFVFDAVNLAAAGTRISSTIKKRLHEYPSLSAVSESSESIIPILFIPNTFIPLSITIPSIPISTSLSHTCPIRPFDEKNQRPSPPRTRAVHPKKTRSIHRSRPSRPSRIQIPLFQYDYEADPEDSDLDPTTHTRPSSISHSKPRPRPKARLVSGPAGVAGGSYPLSNLALKEMENVNPDNANYSSATFGSTSNLTTNSTSTTNLDSTNLNSPTGNGNSNGSGLSPSVVHRPRRRSALALAVAERVTTVAAAIRRGSNNNNNNNNENRSRSGSRSRSRSGSDAVSPQNGNHNHILGGGLLFGRNRHQYQQPNQQQQQLHSGFTTEDDREGEGGSSEDVRDSSVEGSFECGGTGFNGFGGGLEFGLLESDPFANLSTPPSECHSPLLGPGVGSTRMWLQNLSSEVIMEEPEEEKLYRQSQERVRMEEKNLLLQEEEEEKQSVEVQEQKNVESRVEEEKKHQQKKGGEEAVMKRASSTSALHIRFLSPFRKHEQKHEEEGSGEVASAGTDGDALPRSHDVSSHPHPLTNTATATFPRSDGDDGRESPRKEDEGMRGERKRSNSFTDRVRQIVQSRPSLPSLSILANTKIFLPASSTKGGMASRFPSEPWDDPNWSASTDNNHTGDVNGQHHLDPTAPGAGAGAVKIFGRDRSKSVGSGTAPGIHTATTRQEGDPSRFVYGGGGGSSGGGGGEWTQGRRDDGHYSRGNSGSGRPSGNGHGGSGGDGWRPPRSNGSSRTTSEENTRATNSEEGGSYGDEDEEDEDEDSDDMPLAYRPNALSAQKSLRRKIKDERRSRKETIKSKPPQLPPKPQSKPQQTRLATAPAPLGLALPSSKSTRRPSTIETVVHPDDLTARLLRLRTNEGPSSPLLPASPTGRTVFPTLPTNMPQQSSSSSYHASHGLSSPRPSTSTTHSQPRSPMKEQFVNWLHSGNGPAKSKVTANSGSNPNSNSTYVAAPGTSTFLFPTASLPTAPAPSSAPAPAPPLIQRHATERHPPSYHPNGLEASRPKGPMRSMTSIDDPHATARLGGSFDVPTPTPATFATTSTTAFPSSFVPAVPPQPQQQQQQQKPGPIRSRADTLVQKLTPTSVTSKLVRQRANSLHSSSSRAPMPMPMPHQPLPPLPLAGGERRSMDQRSNADGMTMQQRIFIGDMQRFSVVEIGPRTNAREVWKEVVERGDVSPEEAGSGDWMLFEIANDFGMERPVREYEIVMEVYNSWNSDTRMNYFMLKRTPLTPYLAANAIPKVSPTFGGYVEWEQKRGKWTKRWLELREHGLWLSKRQSSAAKEAIPLCALSNFDAYTVTRVHRSPKPFVFSVKSVQNLRLFENVTDYHHVFCCDPYEGAQWVHHILVARSYILHQERTVLFRQLSTSSKTATPAAATSSATSPSLSRNQSPQRMGPPAPLLSVSQSSRPAVLDTFQPMPGSLLSKRA